MAVIFYSNLYFIISLWGYNIRFWLNFITKLQKYKNYLNNFNNFFTEFCTQNINLNQNWKRKMQINVKIIEKNKDKLNPYFIHPFLYLHFKYNLVVKNHLINF